MQNQFSLNKLVEHWKRTEDSLHAFSLSSFNVSTIPRLTRTLHSSCLEGYFFFKLQVLTDNGASAASDFAQFEFVTLVVGPRPRILVI